MSSQQQHFSSNIMGGEDRGHLSVHLTMKDLYAVQDEFTKYISTDELIPKLISKGMLSDSEVYTIRNPYLPPNRRIFELFQSVSNKGPHAPGKILECLMEKPLIPGHMYLASRLSGDSKQDASMKSSSDFDRRVNPIVSRKINNLKFMFADLLLETHRYLVSSGVSVEEFRIFVSFMSASKKNSSSLFFRDHLPSLSSASTIDQIITIINENCYWNHFNYQLLEAVVRKFGDKNIRSKLEDYIDNVISFENTVTLSEYSVSVPKNLTIPHKADFTPIKTTLKSEKEWNRFSLVETRALQKRMCGQLDVQEHALLFQSAEEGSVVITWLVPASIVDTVLVQAERKRRSLYMIGILSLQINDTSILMYDDQDDYENLTVLEKRKTVSYQQQLSDFLSSLDTVERSIDEVSRNLQIHRQMIETASGSVKSVSDYDHLSSTVHQFRSVSVPTVNWSLNRSRPKTVPSSFPETLTNSLPAPARPYKSRSPSPTPVSPSRVQISPLSHFPTTASGRTTPTPEPKQHLRDSKLYQKDESEREDLAGWIKDSGYSDPVEWTNS